jgi:hypothetical protein
MKKKEKTMPPISASFEQLVKESVSDNPKPKDKKKQPKKKRLLEKEGRKYIK